MSKQDSRSVPSEEQQQTKERIISAAARVLAEKGYEATTLREISREAQAAPGLVHYYFGGKDELLAQALQVAGQSFHERIERLAHQMSTNWSLNALLTELCERVDLEPEVYRLRYESFSLGLHNPTIAPRVRERLAERREEIGSVIALALGNMEKSEKVDSLAVNPTLLASLLLALFDGLALQKIMDPTFDLDAAYELLAQALHGLLAT